MAHTKAGNFGWIGIALRHDWRCDNIKRNAHSKIGLDQRSGIIGVGYDTRRFRQGFSDALCFGR